MFYYKINNFKNIDNEIDYKNLNIKKNVAGSQIYPFDLAKNNFCILANTEDVTHEDLVKLTEEEYNILTEEILASYPPTPEDLQQQKIQALEQSIAELSATIAILQTPEK